MSSKEKAKTIKDLAKGGFEPGAIFEDSWTGGYRPGRIVKRVFKIGSMGIMPEDVARKTVLIKGPGDLNLVMKHLRRLEI